jgi:hypothetical protein
MSDYKELVDRARAGLKAPSVGMWGRLVIKQMISAIETLQRERDEALEITDRGSWVELKAKLAQEAAEVQSLNGEVCELLEEREAGVARVASLEAALDHVLWALEDRILNCKACMAAQQILNGDDIEMPVPALPVESEPR